MITVEKNNATKTDDPAEKRTSISPFVDDIIVDSIPIINYDTYE
jgi:hypothetical protein